jgi:small subunit ribosomal protein S15e
MDKKGDKKDAKGAGDKKDAKPQQQKAPAKEEKKEETAEERRQKEEREALKEEKKLHKKEHQRHLHEAHAAGNVMDDLSKKQVFKKFNYRGNDIGKLLSMNMDELAQQLRSRQRRRLKRKMGKKYGRFIKKLMDVKKDAPQGEKPAAVKTHLRNCIVLPSMVQSIINIHNGKGFNSVEVKPEMIGYYLGEFAMTYKKVSHGKPGVGATHSSKFVPIK